MALTELISNPDPVRANAAMQAMLGMTKIDIQGCATPPRPLPPDGRRPMDVLDEARFTELSERHRRELQVHSYRMLGNLEQAEDAVQEALLRA